MVSSLEHLCTGRDERSCHAEGQLAHLTMAKYLSEKLELFFHYVILLLPLIKNGDYLLSTTDPVMREHAQPVRLPL